MSKTSRSGSSEIDSRVRVRAYSQGYHLTSLPFRESTCTRTHIPETRSAPVVSAASSMFRQALRSSTSSLSRKRTYVPHAWAMPWLRGAPHPPLFRSSRKARTRPGYSTASRRATSYDPSVLRSSTITTSTFRKVCSSTERTAVGSRASSL